MGTRRRRTGMKMRMMCSCLCLFACVTMAAFPAMCEEYKYSFLFTVPVQVSNLSVYATGIRLICSVKDANGNWLIENFTGPSYSNNRATLNSSGGFSGNLTYALKLTNPGEASKAKSYQCSVQASSGNSSSNFVDCTGDTGYTCLKPGTPRVLQVQGPIP